MQSKMTTIDNALIARMQQQAEAFGLVMRGAIAVSAEDNVPALQTGESAATLLLFGNAGSSIWHCFSASREFADGDADPLNRWSERIGNQLAARWGGKALFPFGGPPWQPFLQWAKKSEALESSVLGMLIHPRYGLWHAYRFAVALPHRLAQIMPDDAAMANKRHHACTTCAQKPCLNACPVNAFSGTEYDVEACFNYLDSHQQARCHQQGCQARLACPEGAQFRYQPAHARFHISQFYSALKPAT